jgi:26S proteasome regulatory subunit N6
MQVESTKPADAVKTYRAVILGAGGSDADSVKVKEQAIDKLAKLLAKLKDASALKTLLTELRPLFALVPKAKTAKIVRNVIDALSTVPGCDALQVELCKEQVAWAKSEKRTFLRHRVELRLATLHLDMKSFQEALRLIGALGFEVKKLDDKLLLVDIHLLESRIHYALRNMPKGKAALTAARTNSNAIYVPPSVQCMIDMQGGILHAEEKDYKTAYSYFFEGFEQLNNLEDNERAVMALKYMLMCKVMSGQADDVAGLISSKGGLKHQGETLDAMKAVATAYSARSLKDLQGVLVNYQAQLGNDPIIAAHLGSLQDSLMEQNLLRVIEPFSQVEIAHVAKLIELPTADVETKLSQMILDGKFEGILDQGAGCLIVYDDDSAHTMYKATLETIANMDRVVDSLTVKSSKIVA